MAFFKDSGSSSRFCCVIFSRDEYGYCSGVLFGLNGGAQKLVTVFPEIFYAMALMAGLEIVSAALHGVGEWTLPVLALERMDIVLMSCMSCLVACVVAIQLYVQTAALVDRKFYFFDYPRFSFKIDWLISSSFYGIWISAALICSIVLLRWHALDPQPEGRLWPNVLIATIAAIFVLSGLRLQWLWEKRFDQIVFGRDATAR